MDKPKLVHTILDGRSCTLKSVNVYADIHEILMSLGMNIIVAVGFIIDYKNSRNER
jgi:predicted Co/Zn/Cd cation transporter (cation efflux family)